MMNYLKRRFSSGDLQGEGPESDENSNQMLNLANPILNKFSTPAAPTRPPPIKNQASLSSDNQHSQANASTTRPQAISTTNPSAVTKKTTGPSPSAPNSPTKSLSITSMMSAARDILSNNLNNAMQPQQQHSLTKQMSMLKEKTKNLLVIDDSNVDWSRYFRNRKVGDFDLKTEQAEFRKISLGSYVDGGVVVDILVDRNGTKVIKSFKPDFVLVRQHVKNADKDWRNIVIGLKYGCVPSINSIESVYNFRDKPWVFAHLIQIQKMHGFEKFPLINQTYHPNYREMIPSNFPCIVKIGHAHQGLGKIKVENALDFQDITSIVSISNSYSTTEPYIESRYDIHIQKIGDSFKAFQRKSISGNWKANIGSAMLEQIPMNERYKFWIDEVSKMFGGLHICEIQAVVHVDTLKEYIIDVVDSAMSLFGEQQEGDRRLIAELCIDTLNKSLENYSNMQVNVLTLPSATSSSTSISTGVNMHQSISIQNSQHFQPSPSNSSINKQPSTKSPSSNSIKEANSSNSNQPSTSLASNRVFQNPSNLPTSSEMKQPQASLPQSQNMSSVERPKSANPVNTRLGPNQIQKTPNLARSATLNENNKNNNVLKTAQSVGSSEDSEDTMNNLRKTFAGIFGNSNL